MLTEQSSPALGHVGKALSAGGWVSACPGVLSSCLGCSRWDSRQAPAIPNQCVWRSEQSTLIFNQEDMAGCVLRVSALTPCEGPALNWVRCHPNYWSRINRSKLRQHLTPKHRRCAWESKAAVPGGSCLSQVRHPARCSRRSWDGSAVLMVQAIFPT